MKKYLFLCLILALAFGALTASAQDATPEATPEPVLLGTAEDLVPTDAEIEAAKAALGADGFVGIIACTLSTEYHSTVAESANTHLEELGIPSKLFDSEINVEKQISAIENFTSSGAKVIVVCLFDPPSVLSALQAAQSRRANRPYAGGSGLTWAASPSASKTLTSARRQASTPRS